MGGGDKVAPVSGGTSSNSAVGKGGRSKNWKIYLGLEAAVLFLMGLNIATFVPFFVPEARCKGIGLTEIGIFYGFTYIFSAALYPVACFLVTKVEARVVLAFGVVIASVCTVLMGCTHWSPPGNTYRLIVYSTSLVYNVGMIQICAALFSIAPYFDPDRVSFIYGCLETSYQLGQITGPLLGGFLFEYGGFPATTIPFGIILPIVGLIVACCLPKLVIHDSNKVSNWPLCNLWKQPISWVICYVFLAAYGATSFVNTLIVYHLSEFKLSPGQIGVVLFGAGCSFAICSPIIGRFNDKHGYSLVYILFGCIISAAAFLLIGPSPFLQDMFHVLANLTHTYYYGSPPPTLTTTAAVATTYDPHRILLNMTTTAVAMASKVDCWAAQAPAMSAHSHIAATSEFSLTLLAIVVISGVFLSRLGLAFVLAPATRTLFEILRSPTAPKVKNEDEESVVPRTDSTAELLDEEKSKDLDKQDDKTKDLNTSSAVSAVYNSLMSLGGFIGLVFSGPSVDNLGYPVTSSILAFFIGLSAIVVGVALGFHEVKKYQTKKFSKKPNTSTHSTSHHHLHNPSQAGLLTAALTDEEGTALLAAPPKEKLR